MPSGTPAHRKSARLTQLTGNACESKRSNHFSRASRRKWHPFDFAGGVRPDGTYAMRSDFVEREPALVIVLEGAYSTGCALADLIDLTVLVDAPREVRHERVQAREEQEFLAAWHTRWDAAEEVYFTKIRPRSSFDLVVTSKATPSS